MMPKSPHINGDLTIDTAALPLIWIEVDYSTVYDRARGAGFYPLMLINPRRGSLQSSAALTWCTWPRRPERADWGPCTRPSTCCRTCGTLCWSISQRTRTSGSLGSSACLWRECLMGRTCWCPNSAAGRSSFRCVGVGRNLPPFVTSRSVLMNCWTFAPSGPFVQLLRASLLRHNSTDLPRSGEWTWVCSGSFFSSCPANLNYLFIYSRYKCGWNVYILWARRHNYGLCCWVVTISLVY